MTDSAKHPPGISVSEEEMLATKDWTHSSAAKYARGLEPYGSS